MNVIVYPHLLAVGGSQLVAVDLAAAVRDRGHRVTVFGPPGPLVDRVAALRLPYVAAPPAGRRPSRRVMAALVDLARTSRADLVHGYEWPPALEAYYGPQRRLGVPAVATVMSMGVAPFLPPHLPVVVGTAALQADVRARRPGPVHLCEPPVDVAAEAPGRAPGGFRAGLGLAPGDLLVVVVSRLAVELKLEGLLAAVAAVADLAGDLPVHLAVVGDGPARAELARAAAAANARRGRPVVHLLGELLDPRPAYAEADVVLGMGSSALRAMAYARPLVVQGEAGFWETLTPESAPRFCWQGWYGVGDGSPGAPRLAGLLRELLGDRARRADLGAFARQLVVDRFSLTRAAAAQEAVYAAALAAPAAFHPVEAARAASGLVAHQVRRRVARWRGGAPTDDFNARAVLPAALAGSPEPKESLR